MKSSSTVLGRRSFLHRFARAATSVALGPAILDLAGCGGDDGSAPVPTSLDRDVNVGPDAVLLGLYPRADVPNAADAVRHALGYLDFSWLAPGDSVFVKVACNSGNVHPAVTSPAAVRAMCGELLARGAGRVVVGDQSGVETVRLAPGDERFGSTRAHMEANGLLQAITDAGAEPHLFDEHGYDAGYFEATLPFSGSNWTQPMYVPRIVEEVDHIVYLPRLSSHVLCGYTHGHKLAMGWLRDDSRHHVHFDAASIFEKYTEINYATEIRDRLRMTVTLAEELFLDMGPDQGTRAVADPRIVIASNDLAGHDAVSVALLTHVDGLTEKDPSIVLTYGEQSNDLNKLFVNTLVETTTGIPWGEAGAATYTDLVPHAYSKGIAADRALSRAYEIRGSIPSSIRVPYMGRAPDPALQASIASYGGGILDLV